jgi:hypothetical protein
MDDCEVAANMLKLIKFLDNNTPLECFSTAGSKKNATQKTRRHGNITFKVDFSL